MRGRFRGGLIAALLLAAACDLQAPYARTNPFDPGGTIRMRIVGPDSSHALGERLRFAIEADAALPPGPLYVNWQSDNPALLVSAANGEFVVLGASARFTELGITATFGEVPVRRTILLGQSADSLRLACGTMAVPAACDATPMTVGATLDVRPRLVDAFGNVVRSPSDALARAVLAARTAGVVQVLPDGAAAGVIRLRATAAGTSWVVVRVDRGTDSVRVVVSP
jgi:hypothetical protein